MTFVNKVCHMNKPKNAALRHCPLDRSQGDSVEALCGANRSFWHLLTL